jgi:hypothetical protein
LQKDIEIEFLTNDLKEKQEKINELQEKEKEF